MRLGRIASLELSLTLHAAGSGPLNAAPRAAYSLSPPERKRQRQAV
jgi:hypothetical protein